MVNIPPHLLTDGDMRKAIATFEASNRTADDYMQLFGVVNMLRQDGLSFGQMRAAIIAALQEADV